MQGPQKDVKQSMWFVSWFVSKHVNRQMFPQQQVLMLHPLQPVLHHLHLTNKIVQPFSSNQFMIYDLPSGRLSIWHDGNRDKKLPHKTGRYQWPKSNEHINWPKSKSRVSYYSKATLKNIQTITLGEKQKKEKSW